MWQNMMAQEAKDVQFVVHEWWKNKKEFLQKLLVYVLIFLQKIQKKRLIKYLQKIFILMNYIIVKSLL